MVLSAMGYVNEGMRYKVWGRLMMFVRILREILRRAMGAPPL